MSFDRLFQQIAFITEIDKLKSVYRQTMLINRSRNENSAEHSWHLAMLALILQEYANEQVDLAHVMKLVIVHDLIEIDAGDTFAYDEKGYEDKALREQKAAERIFNLLPSEQAQELRALWDEFEERATPEAKFASALDRLQPMLHNYYTEGAAWQKHQVPSHKVVERSGMIREGSEKLWELSQQLIQSAIEKGYLRS